MFGHQKRVERMLEQLEALNKLVVSRKEELDDYENKLQEIFKLYPGLQEVEAMEEYVSSLKEKSALLESKVETYDKKIEEYKSVIGTLETEIDIIHEREKLEEEKRALQDYKRTSLLPKNILIVAYTVPNINDIAIDAFILDGRTRYYSKKKQEYANGTIYKSLGGGREIGFNSDYSDCLSGSFNAFPKQFVTFEEACLALNSDLYLRESVSAMEVHELLQSFKAGFYFYGKTDLTVDEFMSMVKQGKREYDGAKPLTQLLEKKEK